MVRVRLLNAPERLEVAERTLLATHLRSPRSVIFTGLLGIVGSVVQARSQKASEAQASLEREAAVREEVAALVGKHPQLERVVQLQNDVGPGAATDHGHRNAEEDKLLTFQTWHDQNEDAGVWKNSEKLAKC
jgi:hypothetical protein